MGPPKGRAHEKRLADMSLPLPEQRGEPWRGQPNPEHTWRYSVAVGETSRIVYRDEFDDDWNLVDFAFGQQVLHRNAWVNVMRVDCDHGIVHVHRYTRRNPEGDREDLLPIQGQEDIEHGRKITETLINAETCEANERRWRDG
ncbi:hypothetical protein FRAHR75_230004 [Frankia sp. Hr75.2]|nr:hypothetical protein FRAHR75_230004 [Frankia sp. Hr75.2]